MTDIKPGDFVRVTQDLIFLGSSEIIPKGAILQVVDCPVRDTLIGLMFPVRHPLGTGTVLYVWEHECELVGASPQQCSCPLLDLISRGCTCGGV